MKKKAYLLLLLKENASVSEIVQKLKVSRATVYRYKNICEIKNWEADRES